MSMAAVNVQHVFDWLVDGAPGAPGPKQVVDRVSTALLSAGIPLGHTEAFVRTLHPHIAGRSFLWRPGQDVDVREQTYAYLNSPQFLGSPVSRVFSNGETLRRTVNAEACAEFPLLEEMRQEGFTDYVGCPLKFMTGAVHAITFATKDARGFNADQISAINHVVRPLSRVGETFALLRTATNLLNTYVGHNAGERIMSGKIQRGDTDIIRAAIWFSDLRGFTSLSSTLEPGQIIGVLNELFQCQVPAIEEAGGEVLKFIGDGLFGIFPMANRDPGERCTAALGAARKAFAALELVNARRATQGLEPINSGLALHVGDVAYGNIGGQGRLDFTCIGPAVNLAARLEGLTGKLGRNVVVSSEFAKHLTTPVEPLGEFELKGVPGKIAVLAPTL